MALRSRPSREVPFQAEHPAGWTAGLFRTQTELAQILATVNSPQAERSDSGSAQGELQLASAETLEELLSTGQYQDLYALGGVREDVEHQPHPLVVGEHQGIVQYHGGGRTLINQHFCERQAHEDGDLFLSAHAQTIEVLLVSLAARHAGDVQVFVHADFSVREEHLEVGMDTVDDRGEIALSGFALCGTKCVQKEVEDLKFVL